MPLVMAAILESVTKSALVVVSKSSLAILLTSDWYSDCNSNVVMILFVLKPLQIYDYFVKPTRKIVFFS